MEQLTLATLKGRTAWLPGEHVLGTAAWNLPQRPERLELRLFWYTEGRGTRDVEVVRVEPVEAAQHQGQAEFDLALPGAPYSFHGRLISLCWAVELVAEPFGETARLDLTMSPDGTDVSPYGVEPADDVDESPYP